MHSRREKKGNLTKVIFDFQGVERVLMFNDILFHFLYNIVQQKIKVFQIKSNLHELYFYLSENLVEKVFITQTFRENIKKIDIILT